MIVRLIVFILIFMIGWWLYRLLSVSIQQKVAKNQSNSQKEKYSTEQKEKQEAMVRCEMCNTFIPQSHAIHDQKAKAFCSKEHLIEYHQEK